MVACLHYVGRSRFLMNTYLSLASWSCLAGRSAGEQVQAQSNQKRALARAASYEAETAPQSAEDAVRALIRQEGRIATVETADKFWRKAVSVQETQAKPRSMEEVLRRQRIIDQRLTRIETKLKIGTQRQKAKVMPIDQLFAGQSRKPDRQNALMLAIGAVLAIILIVLLVISLLPSGAPTETSPLSHAESEAEPVALEPAGQILVQGTAPPDGGASDCPSSGLLEPMAA
jgi:hypothetical protein